MNEFNNKIDNMACELARYYLVNNVKAPGTDAFFNKLTALYAYRNQNADINYFDYYIERVKKEDAGELENKSQSQSQSKTLTLNNGGKQFNPENYYDNPTGFSDIYMFGFLVFMSQILFIIISYMIFK